MNGLRRAAMLPAAMILVGALAISAAAPGGAVEHPASALKSTSDTAAWSGKFQVATSAGPDACTPLVCDIVPLDVRLPDNVWDQRPGGLLVAIHTQDAGDAGIFLYAYGPDGTQVASSENRGADQALWIPSPVNGRHTVKVVPIWVAGNVLYDGLTRPLTYEGFAKFQHGVTIQREEKNFGMPYARTIIGFDLTDRRPAVELLPDLAPSAPRNFRLAYGGEDTQLPSCLPTETAGAHEDQPDPTKPTLRCLRFDQGEYNVGDGPFQVNVYDLNGPLVPGGYEVHQRIYYSDGDVRSKGPVGSVEFNQAHGHFHLLGFQEVTLHRIEADGSLTFVKGKPDKGICTADIDLGTFASTKQPTAPVGYPVLSGPTCLDFSHTDENDSLYPNEPYFEMGISVGWSDIYPRAYPQQYVDIDTVPPGDYALRVRQNVADQLIEKSAKNNTATGCVRITDAAATDIPCPPLTND